MKILSVHWGFSHGGVATYAANIESLSDRIPVTIRSLCIIPEGRDVDKEILDSIDAIVIPVQSVFDFSWVSHARLIADEEQSDCVMSHGFNGHLVSLILTAGKQQHVKRLASYHGCYHPNTIEKRLIAPIYNAFTNWFLRTKATAIVSVAQFSVDQLVERGVPANKFTVVHNGIPQFEPRGNSTIIRHEMGIEPDHIVICIASRLEKIKGLDYLIEAFASISPKHEKLRLVLIGDGTQRELLEKLAIIRKVDSRIIFTGIRDDIPQCLAAVDIFALPSLSEAHSISLLEAMRAGRAIVATGVGGNTESIRDGVEGLIVKEADINGLSRALDQLASDENLRARLGAAAHQRFCSEFTDEVMLIKTAEWLQAVCHG